MNFNSALKNSFKPFALATLLLATAAPAQAADDLGSRIATGLGNAIAAQGNLAFQQIRQDLKQELIQTFEQWLPEAADAAADTTATDAPAAAGRVQ